MLSSWNYKLKHFDVNCDTISITFLYKLITKYNGTPLGKVQKNEVITLVKQEHPQYNESGDNAV